MNADTTTTAPWDKPDNYSDYRTMMLKNALLAPAGEVQQPTFRMDEGPLPLTRARVSNGSNGSCSACDNEGDAFQQCLSCGAPVEPKDHSWHYDGGWKKGPAPQENCADMIANIRDCSSGTAWELYTYTAVFRAPKSFKDVYKQCLDDTLQVQLKVDGGHTMRTEIADYRVRENCGFVK